MNTRRKTALCTHRRWPITTTRARRRWYPTGLTGVGTPAEAKGAITPVPLLAPALTPTHSTAILLITDTWLTLDETILYVRVYVFSLLFYCFVEAKVKIIPDFFYCNKHLLLKLSNFKTALDRFYLLVKKTFFHKTIFLRWKVFSKTFLARQ